MLFYLTENYNIELVNSKNGKKYFSLIFYEWGVLQLVINSSNYNEISFKYISAIDLDIDGKIEVLAVR